jgi:hypothetical protein
VRRSADTQAAGLRLYNVAGLTSGELASAALAVSIRWTYVATAGVSRFVQNDADERSRRE